MEKNYKYSMSIFTVVAVGSFLLYLIFIFPLAYENYKPFHFAKSGSVISEEPSNDTRKSYQEPAKEEPAKKECYRCKGTGIITCGMCGGTGINNMGMTCGCVTYVANCRAMGKTPTRTALQWTCEHCKGTGYER